MQYTDELKLLLEKIVVRIIGQYLKKRKWTFGAALILPASLYDSYIVVTQQLDDENLLPKSFTGTKTVLAIL